MILRPRDPAPLGEALRIAAMKFLAAIDEIEVREFGACEKAVHRALGRASLGTPFHAVDIWRQAGDIERDPLEKLRPVLGDEWWPNLV